jgi:hypothetical protein
LTQALQRIKFRSSIAREEKNKMLQAAPSKRPTLAFAGALLFWILYLVGIAALLYAGLRWLATP